MTRKPASAEAQHLADLEWLASDPRGRRIVWRLMERADMLGPGTPDAQLGVWLSGAKAAVHEIIVAALVTHFPVLLGSVLTEALARTQDGRRKRSTSRDSRPDDGRGIYGPDDGDDAAG